LRWHLEHNISVVPKSVRAERIKENFAVFDIRLTSEEVAAIDSLDIGARGGSPPETVDDQT
jgi:diketogulonate reductase-like aldo/keto reductase